LTQSLKSLIETSRGVAGGSLGVCRRLRAWMLRLKPDDAIVDENILSTLPACQSSQVPACVSVWSYLCTRHALHLLSLQAELLESIVCTSMPPKSMVVLLLLSDAYAWHLPRRRMNISVCTACQQCEEELPLAGEARPPLAPLSRLDRKLSRVFQAASLALRCSTAADGDFFVCSVTSEAAHTEMEMSGESARTFAM
jgi:hypothetical protein